MKNFKFYFTAFSLILLVFSCNNAPSESNDTKDAERTEKVKKPVVSDGYMPQSVVTQGVVNKPIVEVWESISEFGKIHLLAPGIFSDVEVEQTVTHIRRTCKLADGKGEIVEELVNRELANFLISYKGVSSPFDLKDFNSKMVATIKKDTSSILSWSATFNVKPEDRTKAYLFYKNLQEKVFETLDIVK